MTRVKKWAYKKDGQIVKILYGRLWQFWMANQSTHHSSHQVSMSTTTRNYGINYWLDKLELKWLGCPRMCSKYQGCDPNQRQVRIITRKQSHSTNGSFFFQSRNHTVANTVPYDVAEACRLPNY